MAAGCDAIADSAGDVSGAGKRLFGEVEHAGKFPDAAKPAGAAGGKHEFALLKIKINNLHAFTLVEMILAIGVAAIVLIAINAVLFAALHLREATGAVVDAATPVDQAMTFLRRDLQCAMTPTNGTTKVLSGDFKVGNVSSLGVSEPVAIELFTTTGALGINAPWGDVQRVTYELKTSADRSSPGRDLVRSVTRNLLTLTAPVVDDQLMLSGVASIKFSCYDGVQWQETWDTTGMTSVNTNLPLAVRVDIQMSGNNNAAPVEILVPIDSQSRTNMVLTATTGT
jgi:type II secretion system protein J